VRWFSNLQEQIEKRNKRNRKRRNKKTEKKKSDEWFGCNIFGEEKQKQSPHKVHTHTTDTGLLLRIFSNLNREPGLGTNPGEQILEEFRNNKKSSSLTPFLLNKIKVQLFKSSNFEEASDVKFFSVF